MNVLRFLNATRFGITDPVFGRDLSAYVFTLPLVGGFLGMLRTLVTISLIIVLGIFLRGKVSLPPQRISLIPPADRHVAILLVLFLALTALQVWFARLSGLLFSTTGPLVGASYSDLHARYHALHIIAITAVVGALAVIYGMMRRRIAWFTARAAAAYIAVSIVIGGIYPWVVQRLFVAPTELTREAPQLRSHILATRRAWGLEPTRQSGRVGEQIVKNKARNDESPAACTVARPGLRATGQFEFHARSKSCVVP